MRDKNSPEKKARKVVEECADCDVCRFLMDVDCMVFPELYRLYDKEADAGEDITPVELRHLVDLCNFWLQFNQLLPYKVQHPIELIKEAYSTYSTAISK